MLATQNPIELEGTYPLPEAQLDRFMMRIAVGYPSREKELEMLDTHGAGSTYDDLEAVVTGADVVDMMQLATTVHVADVVKGYLVTWPTPPGATRTCCSGSRPGRPSTCCADTRSTPPPPAATTCRPTTSRRCCTRSSTTG